MWGRRPCCTAARCPVWGRPWAGAGGAGGDTACRVPGRQLVRDAPGPELAAFRECPELVSMTWDWRTRAEKSAGGGAGPFAWGGHCAQHWAGGDFLPDGAGAGVAPVGTNVCLPAGGKLDLDRLQFLVSRSGRKRTLHSQHCSNSSDRLWGAEGNAASRLGSWLSSLRETGGQRPREGVWRPHGWSGAVCL